MRLEGKLTSVKGTEVTVRLDDEPNALRLRQLAAGKQPSVGIDVEDGRTISPEQRKKTWAMIRDYADYTGYTPPEMEEWLKSFYMADRGAEYFSLSNVSMEQAADFLTFIIDFGFQHGIPWKTQTLDAIPSAYPLMLRCMQYKLCVICGKHAEIDHEPPIGRGFDRNHIDNRKFKFFPLCHTHHMIRHTRGIDWFMDFYHIKPVSLDEDTIVSLRLNSRKQLRDFDEEASNGTAPNV